MAGHARSPSSQFPRESLQSPAEQLIDNYRFTLHSASRLLELRGGEIERSNESVDAGITIMRDNGSFDVRSLSPLGVELPDVPLSLIGAASRFDRSLLRLTNEIRTAERAGAIEISRSFIVVATPVVGGEAITFVSGSLSHLEEFLLQLPGERAATKRFGSFPILFSQGSAAVLAHEMIGHPAEVSSQLGYPEWLSIVDDPRGPLLTMKIDDEGNQTRRADLTRGDQPSAFRRAGFRDVPLRRMTNTLVTSTKEVDLPEDYIQIEAVGDCSLLRASSALRIGVVSSALVRRGERSPLAPFTLHSTPGRVSAAMIGSRGAVVTYPGVLCSEEGQRLPVGAASVDLLIGAEGFD